MQAYVEALADLIYPQRCVGCERRANDLLCRDCFENLPLIEGPLCRRCGVPTAFDTFVCEECKNVDFGFESARAALRYEGVGKEIVHALKYRGYMRTVDRLISPLMRSVLEDSHRFDAVVPVPLHRSRLRKRGFNQAELIAQSIAREVRANVSDTLEVVRKTRDQVQLTRTGRRENMAGAFRSRGRVRGRVLLVDDVFTTGATTSECANVLTRSGAESVDVLTLCRTC